MLSRKENAVAIHLGQDATDGPEVDGFGVNLRREHDFRCAVPSGGHVLGQQSSLIALRIGNSCESKIAYLK